MPAPASRLDFKNYCLRKLGAPVIEINVADEQLEDRIDEGLQKWSDYHFDGSSRYYWKHKITQEDVHRQYIEVSDEYIGIDMNDKDVNMNFMLEDFSVIRKVQDLKQLPDWSTSINLSKEFIDKFVKAKNAIPESENFGVTCKDNVAEIIINYSSINTNRIKFSVKCDNED